MNIWVIGRSYPQKSNNMQGSFELEQAKMLAKHGNKVSYIACVFHPFKKVKKWGYCHWEEDNVQIYTFSQFYAIERMKLHLEFFQSYKWKKHLSKVEADSGYPDIIHVHYPANITTAKDVLVYQTKGTKVICTEHWTQVLKEIIDNYERQRLKEYADHADTFLCVGYPLKEAVERITKTKREIYVVPNIVNDVFRPSNRKKEGFNFIAVGVLFPHKQFDKIIEAFASLYSGKKDVFLTIVGDGPEYKKLTKLVEKYKVSQQVKFTGKLNRNETAEQVSSSNCLICYSNCETFGVPIIEAWACGLPVIATTAASVRDGWDEKLGFQVSPDDINQLKECMNKVIREFKLYNQEYITKYALENYSEEKIYHTLIDYYIQ